MYWVLNDANEPVQVSFEEWRTAASYKVSNRVALTMIDHVRVSTVFMYVGDWPYLWETMIFAEGYPGHPLDQEGGRYGSHAEALAGHEAWCARVRLASTPHGLAAWRLGGLEALDALTE